jgi:riboflavin biosynthesis pyrimidine reductase
MTASVLRLHPGSRNRLPLKGLYLELGLHRAVAENDILIYANYITSLDGRISLKNPDSGEFGVPPPIANKRDWRLYQELAAQSDVMITSARYFRQMARGVAQDLLPVGKEPEYADLKAWREAQGLKPQPDIAIVSASLDIPPAALDAVADRAIHVLTHAQTDVSKRKALARHGANVVVTGENVVDGMALREALRQMGFRSAYMIAGPGVHHTLVAAGALDRLFITCRHMLLGGRDYHTILEDNLPRPAHMQLESLYLDQGVEPGQTYAQYILRQGCPE